MTVSGMQTSGFATATGMAQPSPEREPYVPQALDGLSAQIERLEHQVETLSGKMTSAIRSEPVAAILKEVDGAECCPLSARINDYVRRISQVADSLSNLNNRIEL